MKRISLSNDGVVFMDSGEPWSKMPDPIRAPLTWPDSAAFQQQLSQTGLLIDETIDP